MKNIDAMPNAETHSQQELTPEVRAAFESSRSCFYEEYGERKVVVTTVNGRRCEIRNLTEGVYSVTFGDETRELSEPSDIAFAAEIFSRDIPPNIRELLNKDRTVSYENHGETKVVSIEQGDTTYKFYRDDREYAYWAMDTYRGDAFVETVDIREPDDTTYLEALFSSDLSEGLRRALSAEGTFVNGDDMYPGQRMRSVQYNGKEYRVFEDEWEPDLWKLGTYDEQGALLELIDLREQTDTTYLRSLFGKSE